MSGMIRPRNTNQFSLRMSKSSNLARETNIRARGKKPMWQFRKSHYTFRSRLIFAGVFLSSIHAFAQDGLQYKVNYHCGGERIEVAYCRHDSDMPGYPRTTPQNDYCLVYYPDRPMRGGFMVQESELRSEIVRKLQACGALAGEPQTAAPQPTPSSLTADDYIKQAEPYFKGKDAAKAIDPLKKAIALTPSSTAYNDLGIAYTNLDQYANAASAFEQAARLSPSNANIGLNLGFAYLKLQKYDKAIAALRETLRLKPDFADAANQLGMALEDSKRYADAVAAYQYTIRVDPHYTAGYSNLGSLFAKSGKREEAIEIYRELQKIDQDEATALYRDIIDADADAKEKVSASDRAKAYEKLDSAALLAKANQGDDAAMKRVSDLYYQKHDNANGLQWLIKAAEHGDPELQDAVGWKYEKSNTSEARKWYRKAAEQGNDTAQLHLCESYATELALDDGVFQGPGKDDLQAPIAPLHGSATAIDEAFRWCQRGGNQHLVRAAWLAGVLWARGSQAHPAKYDEAYFWLSFADVTAGAKFRQKVAQHLTAAQRGEIEKRAANFLPSPMELLHDAMVKRSAGQ